MFLKDINTLSQQLVEQLEKFSKDRKFNSTIRYPTSEYIFFSIVCEINTKRDHILSQKTNVNKFKTTEFSGSCEVKVDTDNIENLNITRNLHTVGN